MIWLCVLSLVAVGCPKLNVPKDGWAQVDGETAVIRCNFTDETWYLTCKGTSWLGQTGNCTKGEPLTYGVHCVFIMTYYVYISFISNDITIIVWNK